MFRITPYAQIEPDTLRLRTNCNVLMTYQNCFERLIVYRFVICISRRTETLLENLDGFFLESFRVWYEHKSKDSKGKLR